MTETRINAATRLTAGSPKAVLAKINALITDKERLLHSLEKEKHNPTVAPSYWAAKGTLEALVAVRDALKGNNVNLNML